MSYEDEDAAVEVAADGPTAPMLLTRRELAVLFSRDSRTIARWLEDGLPVAAAGKGRRPAKYDAAACVQWVIQREIASVAGTGEGLSPQQERGMLDRKRREELELKLRVRRGELVERETVEGEFAGCATATKARLRRVPAAVADRVVSTAREGAHAVKALLLAEIDEALLELARRGAGPEVSAVEPDA